MPSHASGGERTDAGRRAAALVAFPMLCVVYEGETDDEAVARWRREVERARRIDRDERRARRPFMLGYRSWLERHAPALVAQWLDDETESS